jgi:hypothetical protein
MLSDSGNRPSFQFNKTVALEFGSVPSIVRADSGDHPPSSQAFRAGSGDHPPFQVIVPLRPAKPTVAEASIQPPRFRAITPLFSKHHAGYGQLRPPYPHQSPEAARSSGDHPPFSRQ